MIKIDELVDAVQSHGEGCCWILNLKNNHIEMLTDDILSMVDSDKNHSPDWMKESLELAKLYVNNPDDFIELPTQWDANEYEMI